MAKNSKNSKNSKIQQSKQELLTNGRSWMEAAYNWKRHSEVLAAELVELQTQIDYLKDYSAMQHEEIMRLGKELYK